MVRSGLFWTAKLAVFVCFDCKLLWKHWSIEKKHVRSDLGDIHMTKQLLNKKNINMDQRSLSHMSVEVFSSIEDWASKLLLGGGKVKGWTMFCCASVFFRETPVIQLRGRQLGPSRLCKWSAILVLGTITTIIGNRGIFLPASKNHGTWYEWTKISGERKKHFSCLCRFRFLPNFHKTFQKSLQGPQTFVGIPHVNRLLGWFWCWDLLGNDSKHSWTQRTLPHAEENWWKIHAKGDVSLLPRSYQEPFQERRWIKRCNHPLGFHPCSTSGSLLVWVGGLGFSRMKQQSLS